MAATFYVSPTGNDGNPGTEERPWASAFKSARTAQAGDTVIFEDGTYAETRTFRPVNSGTLTAPIVFKARNRRRGVWNFGRGLRNSDKVLISGKDHIVLEGLEITQETKGTTAFLDQMVKAELCTGVRLTDCDIHKVAYYLVRPINQAVNFVIEDCVLHDAGFNLIDAVRCDNIVICRCELYDWGMALGSAGVAAFIKGGSRGGRIYNNYAHDPGPGAGYGYMLGGSSDIEFSWHPNGVNDGYEAYNLVAWNNVIVLNPGSDLWSGFSMLGTKDCTYANCVYVGNGATRVSRPITLESGGGRRKGWSHRTRNLNPRFCNMIVHAPPNGADFSSVESGLRVEYLVWYQNGGASPPMGLAVSNVISADPRFVDPVRDWRTEPESPARGFGHPVVVRDYDGSPIDISRDFYGVAREERWDAGAVQSRP